MTRKTFCDVIHFCHIGVSFCSLLWSHLCYLRQSVQHAGSALTSLNVLGVSISLTMDWSARPTEFDEASARSDMTRAGDSPSASSSYWKKPPRHQIKSAASTHKVRQVEWILQLQDVADGLMTKIYRLRQMLQLNDNGITQFSDAFWKSGLFPNSPKLCLHVAKKFPEHPVKLQPEKVDRGGFDLLRDNAEVYLTRLEAWILVLLDLMTFREQALRVILDLSSTIITLLPNQNPLILHVFMELLCVFVRVNLYADKIPRKMILQIYNLSHTISKGGRDYEFYHRLVQFIDSYDPPLKGLHEDLNFVSPRIGEILDGIGSTIFLGSDFERIRSEGFLSPYHPRYPEKLTNSAHPARAQELANIHHYREWVLLGYLVCPSEFLRIGGADIAMAVLKDTLVWPLFRDDYIPLHEEYQQYVLPKISESRKMAKVGRMKSKEGEPEYSLAKQVEKIIFEAHEQAMSNANNSHRERRVILKNELARMVLFFSDQPSLIAPNIQMVFAALAVTRSELIWFFSHAGIILGKSKANRVVPVAVDPMDSTIGFLLSSMEKLTALIRKYTSAIKGYALGYVVSATQRMRILFESPGMIALDLDAELRQHFNSAMQCLEKLPPVQNDKLPNTSVDISEFRIDWLRILMMISSSRSLVNIRHLEKATVSTGKESIVSEGNLLYLWSRSVDDIEKLLSQHGSLKVLCFYRENLNMVFRHTMYGPEGWPQNCCAWLNLASLFSDNAHCSVPDELPILERDAISYAEKLLEAIMEGMDGLINILNSEDGLGSLESQLLPEQASLRLNYAVKCGTPSSKTTKSNLEFPLPGFESRPSNQESIKVLEAAIQRLTGLCSEINEMEPLHILNDVFVPREYLRERVLNKFRMHLMHVIMVDGELQRPVVIEAYIHRYMTIVHLIEQHVSMDLTRGLREMLIKESFAGPLRQFVKADDESSTSGSVVRTICEWYIENIVKDVKGAGISFIPLEKCYKSVRPLGKMPVEMTADIKELKAFVRVFGPYGVDKLESSIREQLSVLINCIDITLRSNREALESLATSMHNQAERDLALKSIVELETLMNFSLQVGHTLSLRWLLAEACSQVLESTAPLLFSLFKDFVHHCPSSIPEKKEILKVKALACQIGAAKDQDPFVVHSILMDLGGAGDSTWSLLPYLYIACMTSQIWNSSSFSIHTGGFDSNVHCLVRCINSLIISCEMVRYERKELQKQLLAQQHGHQQSGRKLLFGSMDSEALTLEGTSAVEASIKSMMKIFIQGSTVIAMESWNSNNRYPLVAKLIFLDQLCDHSKYLPRSILEAHIPRSILRSIYQLYYDDSVLNTSIISQSKRHISGRAIGDGADTVADGCIANSRSSIFSGAAKLSTQRRKPIMDLDLSDEINDSKHSKQNERYSGPVEYSENKKVSFVDGTADKVHDNSPLRRFLLSRSGPMQYVGS